MATGLLCSNPVNLCSCGTATPVVWAVHVNPAQMGPAYAPPSADGTFGPTQNTVIAYQSASASFNYNGPNLHLLELKLSGPVTAQVYDANGNGPLSLQVFNGIKSADINGSELISDGPLTPTGSGTDWQCTPSWGLDWILDSDGEIQSFFPQGMTFISNWFATWPVTVKQPTNLLVSVTLLPLILSGVKPV